MDTKVCTTISLDIFFDHYYSSLEKLITDKKIYFYSDQLCKIFVSLTNLSGIKLPMKYSKHVNEHYITRLVELTTDKICILPFKSFSNSELINGNICVIPFKNTLKSECLKIIKSIFKKTRKINHNLYFLDDLLSDEYIIHSNIIDFIFGPHKMKDGINDLSQVGFPDGATACLGIVEEDFDYLMKIFS